MFHPFRTAFTFRCGWMTNYKLVSGILRPWLSLCYCWLLLGRPSSLSIAKNSNCLYKKSTKWTSFFPNRNLAVTELNALQCQAKLPSRKTFQRWRKQRCESTKNKNFPHHLRGKKVEESEPLQWRLHPAIGCAASGNRKMEGNGETTAQPAFETWYWDVSWWKERHLARRKQGILVTSKKIN